MALISQKQLSEFPLEIKSLATAIRETVPCLGKLSFFGGSDLDRIKLYCGARG